MSGLRHIVLARWRPEASADERQALLAALTAMPARVPEIRSLRAGENIGASPHAFDLAVVMDFDDGDAFRRYLASGAHREYAAGPAARAIASLAVVQHG